MKISSKKYLTACDGCGELVEIPKVDLQHQYSCSHCNHVLYRPGERFLTIILMAISSLLLLVPALIFPVISLEIFGVVREMSLIQTGLYFLDTTYAGVGFIVMFTAILFPVLAMFLLIYILIQFRVSKKFSHIKNQYIFYTHLKNWGFIDVYLLSIIISMIKLEKMGVLKIDVGLISFFFSMLFYTFAITLFNPKDIWYAKDLNSD